MTKSALNTPQQDPTLIFEHFRGFHATGLLALAVSEFKIFELLAEKPLSKAKVQNELGLNQRPFTVFTTGLKALGFLSETDGELKLTSLAQDHLHSKADFDVSGYVGLAAGAPFIHELKEHLQSDKPAGSEESEEGAAFIFKEGLESAMEAEESARQLTLALAGRAKIVAPKLAEVASLEGIDHVIDLGGGTGIYSIALLQKHPNLKATVIDRPEVLKVAQEFSVEYGVTDRLNLQAGDMFNDPLPQDAQAILLSNILHDWDIPENKQLLSRCSEALPSEGHIWIHDVFLNDALDGPLPIALYSVDLFRLTEGRAYSQQEYREWLHEIDFTASEMKPTAVHCGLLDAIRD